MFEVKNGVKIGVTYDICYRLTTHESASLMFTGKPLGRIAISVPVINYYKVEKAIHDRLRDKELIEGREIYRISFLNAISTVREMIKCLCDIDTPKNWHTVVQHRALKPTKYRNRRTSILRNTINELYKGKLYA